MANMTTLTGEETAIKNYLTTVKNEHKSRYGDLSIETLDCSEIETTTLQNAIESVPFLVEKKLVIIDNLGSNKSLSEQAETIFKTQNDLVEIILLEPKLDRRSGYFKFIKRATNFNDFKQLKDNQLVDWVIERVNSRQAEISTTDARYLVDITDGNQLALETEVAKLAVHGKISRELIDQLVEPALKSRVFDLLEASLAGEIVKTQSIYQEQRLQKVEPQAIMAMVIWQLQMLALAKTSTDSIRQTAEHAGTKTFPLEKAARVAKNISLKQLKQLIDYAIKTDERIKNSNSDADEATRLMLMKFVQVAR